MNWLEVKVDTAPAGLDAVSERLEALGVTGLVIDDEADFHDFLEHNHQYWDYVDDALMQEKRGLSRVTFYLPDDADGEKLLSDARAALSALEQANPACAPIHVAVGKMADSDWENNWKQFYKPMEIGERLIVIPEWESANVPAGRAALVLNPGLTFGTGEHASTQLCMRALESLLHGGERVADLGSGSGILSVSALRLGAASAVGVDIDPSAEHIAAANAAQNGFGPDRFTARTGDVVEDADFLQALAGDGFDIVCANIVADVIIRLAPVVPKLMRPDAAFVCSGILTTREDDVRAALAAAGLEIVHAAHEGEWCGLTARLGAR